MSMSEQELKMQNDREPKKYLVAATHPASGPRGCMLCSLTFRSGATVYPSFCGVHWYTPTAGNNAL